MGCHAERSEASAFIFLKTNNCRFFAALRMTGIADFFTPSGGWVGEKGKGVGSRKLEWELGINGNREPSGRRKGVRDGQ
jgi:hypothetical protein